TDPLPAVVVFELPLTVIVAAAPALRTLPVPFTAAVERDVVVLVSVVALELPPTVRPEPAPTVVELPLPVTWTDERSPTVVALDAPLTIAVEAAPVVLRSLPPITRSVDPLPRLTVSDEP